MLGRLPTRPRRSDSAGLASISGPIFACAVETIALAVCERTAKGDAENSARLSHRPESRCAPPWELREADFAAKASRQVTPLRYRRAIPLKDEMPHDEREGANVGGLLFGARRLGWPLLAGSMAIRGPFVRCGEAKASRTPAATAQPMAPAGPPAAQIRRPPAGGSAVALVRDVKGLQSAKTVPNLLPLPWNSWGPVRLVSQSCASQQHLECVCLSPPCSSLPADAHHGHVCAQRSS